MVNIQKLRTKKAGSGRYIPCLGIFQDKDGSFWILEGKGHSAIPDIFSWTDFTMHDEENTWIQLELNPGYILKSR